MTSINKLERSTMLKEAEIEQEQERKQIKLQDAIFRYIEDREPNILAEVANAASKDGYHWPELIAMKVIRHLESPRSSVIKTMIKMEIGAIILDEIISHAERIVTLED